MADFALGGEVYSEQGGFSVAATDGTVVPLPAVAATKGSWVEIIAATSKDADSICIMMRADTAATELYLLDIGVGASGSEAVIVPNLFHYNKNDWMWLIYDFDVAIPAGSRIAARAQSTDVTPDQVVCAVSLYKRNFKGQPARGGVIDIGTDIANTTGPSIDPGATANTKGSWTEITASLARDIKSLTIAANPGFNGSLTSCMALIDIAIGPSGSEVAIIENFPYWANGTEIANLIAYKRQIELPAGTRIAARASSNIIDAADRIISMICYGEY